MKQESRSESSGQVKQEGTDPQSQDGDFAYVHDPRDNAGAMEDIIENADAAYGFSPDPQSPRLTTLL